MIIDDTKLDFNDLLMLHSVQSTIDSRKDINIYYDNGMLPLFTAPMDTVVDHCNYEVFLDNKIQPILPRTVDLKSFNPLPDTWYAVGLIEFEKIINAGFNDKTYILIDIANGCMKKMHDLVEKGKSLYGDNLILMVGNIANPKTYELLSELGADYVRCGIGGGNACLTSQNVGVGYPMASLIKECYDISCTLDHPAKIVADGGLKNYSDIIKSLGLGADYCMIGSLFNKALESAGETVKANVKHIGAETWTEPGEVVNQYSDDVKNAFKNGAKFNKKFRGMSTKSVQKLLNNEVLRTSEGVVRINPVEYTLQGWIENFSDYLASEMSYSGARNLGEFIGRADFVKITQNGFNRFNK